MTIKPCLVAILTLLVSPGCVTMDSMVESAQSVPADGPHITQHGGNAQSLEVYCQGKRNGPWFGWEGNSSPFLLVFYEDGKLVGSYCLWHSNGRIAEQGQFTDGVATGTWMRFHANGRLAEMGLVAGGQKRPYSIRLPAALEYCVRTGVWLQWDADGNALPTKHYD